MTDQPSPAPGAPAPLPPSAPGPGGVRPLDLLAAAILVVGGVLTLASTFAPMKVISLGRVSLRPDAREATVTIGLWGEHFSGPVVSGPSNPLRLGIPLVIGAILLIVLSLLALPTGNNRRVVVLRPLSIGAAGVVIGAIWTAALYFSNVGGGTVPSEFTTTNGAGWPLLLAAGATTGLGLIVALVSFWRGRQVAVGGGAPAGPARPTGDVMAYTLEPETPPYGIPPAGPVAEIPESPPTA